MKSIAKVKIWSSSGFLFLLMVLILTKCYTFLSVDQPETLNASEEFTVKIQLEIDPTFTDNYINVVAMLVPTSWNAAENTTISFTSSKGSVPLFLANESEGPTAGGGTWPEQLRQSIGIGDNLIDEVEWIVFKATSTIAAAEGEHITAEITVTTTAGAQNLIAQLGYFVGSQNLDLSQPNQYGVYFPPCVTVTNGNGDIMDYCNPQVISVSPGKALDNDIITINMDASVTSTALAGADKVYLCATGFTAGGSIPVCSLETTAEMASLGEDKWRIDLWPRQYFGLDESQTLERIEFSFTDENGENEVIDPNTNAPFSFQFQCD